MKRLLSGRTGSALAVGVVAALAAGGGYAIAAGTSNTIRACASKTTGALRVASRCKSTENALSWNRVGPTGPRGLPGAPGPGAKVVVYNAAAVSQSEVPKKIGTVGPWTIYGQCVIDNTGTVSGGLWFSGPALTEDSWGVYQDSPIAATTTAMAATKGPFGADLVTAYSNASGSPPTGYTGLTATWISRSGSYLQNVVMTATSVDAGQTNACHASDAVTPLG
jgi:hypothetical protein